jgi:hypothetical protein
MSKHQFLARSMLTAAIACAAALVQPAHAGLLGGAGSGSLGGGFGPRGLDVGGQAAAQASRNGAGLPRSAQSSIDKVREPAAATRNTTAGAQAGGATSGANAATAANSTTPSSPAGRSLSTDASAQASVGR